MSGLLMVCGVRAKFRCFTEIEVTVIPAKDKGSINITGIVEKKVLAVKGNPFAEKVWREVQLKMSLPFYDRWAYRQMTLIFM